MPWYYYLLLGIIDVEANFLGQFEKVKIDYLPFFNYFSCYRNWKYILFLFFWNVVVKAYQYTSLTSVMLLDCWAIPCVMLLTWILLRTQYGIKKFIGVAICVAGIVLDVFSDVHAEDRASNEYLFSYNIFAVMLESELSLFTQ
jgi:solute carrier family 35, member F1/2